MTCYNPLTAYQSIFQVNPETGRHQLTFKLKDVVRPYKTVHLPCGKCLGCRADISKTWALRCFFELADYDDSCFITFTYDDDHLPVDGSLHKNHFQKFLKRYRKSAGPVRYFMCGEYGDRTLRPHYHAIFFGHDLPDKFRYDSSLYTSQLLDDLWGYGQCKVGDVTMASISYVASYVTKKLADNRAYKALGVQPPYRSMSTKPAIGKNFYSRYKDWAYSIGYLTMPGGVKCQIPRIFDRWLEVDDPARYEKVKKDRENRIAYKNLQNLSKNAADKYQKYVIMCKSRHIQADPEVLNDIAFFDNLYKLRSKELIHLSKDALYNHRNVV